MKNTGVILVLLILVGCSQNIKTHIPKKNIIHILDLREFTNKGFKITPEKLGGDYVFIGPVNSIFLPEANREKINVNNNENNKIDFRGMNATNSSSETEIVWVSGQITANECIELIYQNAIELGGNSIREFSIESYTESILINEIERVQIYGYIIKGYLIKE